MYVGVNVLVIVGGRGVLDVETEIVEVHAIAGVRLDFASLLRIFGQVKSHSAVAIVRGGQRGRINARLGEALAVEIVFAVEVVNRQHAVVGTSPAVA